MTARMIGTIRSANARLGSACLLGACALAAGSQASEPATTDDPSISLSESTPSIVEIDESSDLDALILYAERTNPALRAAEHRYRAAGERIQQAKAFPDPTLRLAVALEPIETRVGPQDAQLSYSQAIPGRGKRGQRAEIARADAETAREEYEHERRRLGFRIADAYYELYLLARSTEITSDNRDILIYVEQIVRKAYETGNAPYADLIRSQVEIGKLENDLRSLADQRRAVEAHINSLLHRPSDASLPAPRLADAPLTLRPEAELRAMIDESAPDVEVLDARLAGAEQRVRLTEIDDRLDWKLSLSYLPTGEANDPTISGSGDDPIYAGVSVSLPVWRKKYRAAEREAREHQSAVLEARREVEDGIVDRLERLLYRFHNADRELRLYRDTLIPKSGQSLEASQAGLRTGNVSVLDLLDTTRVLLQFQLAFERAKTERERAVAEMRYLLGDDVLLARAETPGAEGTW